MASSVAPILTEYTPCMHILKMARLNGSQWQNCKLNIFANILFFGQAGNRDRQINASTLQVTQLPLYPEKEEGRNEEKAGLWGCIRCLALGIGWKLLTFFRNHTFLLIYPLIGNYFLQQSNHCICQRKPNEDMVHWSMHSHHRL